MLFWNSKNRIWTSISDINIDTLNTIADYCPGHLIGQACPSIVVTPMAGLIWDVVVCWTIPKLNPLSPIGLVLSEGFYKTEVDYAYPISLNNNEWGLTKLSNFFNIENGIFATAGSDFLGFDPFNIPLLYMEDLINGSNVLGQGVPSMNPIKLTYLSFAFASNDDINSESVFRLEQNYPNPFNPSTKIRWQSSSSRLLTLKIFDLVGREIATLLNEYREAGKYEVDFNYAETLFSMNMPSGVYFYRLQIGEYFQTKKMILPR